jgi:hypothetical protein
LRGAKIVGTGKIPGFDRSTEAPHEMAVVEVVEFCYGIQPQDAAYITNRQDSVYSFDNFVVNKKLSEGLRLRQSGSSRPNTGILHRDE